MDQQEDSEMGRFKPKGGKNEPNEPFLPDEMLEPGHPFPVPHIKGLHLPEKPLTKKKLKTFLIELKPIIQNIGQLSHRDQHLVGDKLQDLKGLLQAESFSAELGQDFEELVVHFNALLTHSHPSDQEAVLEKIKALDTKL